MRFKCDVIGGCEGKCYFCPKSRDCELFLNNNKCSKDKDNCKLYPLDGGPHFTSEEMPEGINYFLDVLIAEYHRTERLLETPELLGQMKDREESRLFTLMGLLATYGKCFGVGDKVKKCIFHED